MAAIPSLTPLLPLLRQLHLLPDLPPSLRQLTFPELCCHQSNQKRPKRQFLSTQLLDLNRVSPQLRDAYLSDPGIGRLFALLDGEMLTLFSIREGRELISMGHCSAALIGDRSAFVNCDRPILERLFPSPLCKGIVVLTPSESFLIAESSPLGALRCWILPQKEGQGALFDSLFDRFPELITSYELTYLLAEEGTPEAIRLATQRGIRFNEADQRRRTPLHRAVQIGKVENALALIASGAEKNFQDLDGRTPLHLSLIQGNLPMVEALLEEECDPSLLTYEGESLLHLAVSQGSTDLVAFLLKHPLSQEWLHQRDSDGKIPLHRAVWREPKPAIVSLLLEAGSQIDKVNNYGYTALHWAAKHGHLDSTQLLLNAGARIDLCNQNGNTPFDLALKWGQDEIVWLLLGGEENFPSQAASSSSSSSSSDPEGAAYLAFEAAYESGKKEAELFWLQKLAQIKIDKGDYITAAHLLNGSFAIAQGGEVSPPCSAHLLNQLERIESLFLWEIFQIKAPTSHRNYLKNHREELQRIRTEAADLIKEGWAIEKVQERLTKSYQILLNILLDECITLIGKGYPDGFAVMGLGSMARLEMCPYSDLEFAFLIEDSSPERLDYFRKLSQLLTLKMVNMGETKCEILRFKRGKGDEEDRPAKSFVSSGFSMDIGGLCPSGKNGVYELIGTPTEFARFQTEEWLHHNESEIILVNAMTTVCCVSGDKELVKKYKKEIFNTLNTSIGSHSFLSVPLQLRQKRALELIRGYVEEFQPRLNQDKVDLRAFDVKKELYRLPQMVISSLALYYGLRGTNTLERIKELGRKGFFSRKGANRLKRVFQLVLKLRTETHLFYKTEREILYYPRAEEVEEGRLLVISPEIGQQLLEIYRTLVPLHEGAQAFLAGNSKTLARSSLYKDSVGDYDPSLRKNYRYEAALKNAESAVALSPSSLSQVEKGRIHLDMGQARQALQSFQEAYLLLKQELGDRPHLAVAINLSELGNAYHSLNQGEHAIDYWQKALAMYQQVDSNPINPEVIKCLYQLGTAYEELGQRERAEDYYKQALIVERKIDDQTHPEIDSDESDEDELGLFSFNPFITYYTQALNRFKQIDNNKSRSYIANTLRKLGKAYASLGMLEIAISYYEQSLAMLKKLHRHRPHLDIINNLKELGFVYMIEHGGDSAIDSLKESLAMERQLYGHQPHPDVAASLEILGVTYQGLGKTSHAISCYEESFAIMKQIYGDQPNSDIASVLGDLGDTYSSLGETSRAISYYKQLLAMRKQLYDNQPHLDIAESLKKLGQAYEALGKTSQAISYYEQLLAMRKQLYYNEQPHLDIAESLNKLGSIHKALGDTSRAIFYYEQLLLITKQLYSNGKYSSNIKYYTLLLQIEKEIYGDRPYPEIAQSLNNLGSAYQSTSDYSRALYYYEQSFTMRRQLYGDQPHFDTAESLNSLGNVHKALGKTSQAICYYEQLLMMRRQLYDEQPHLDIAESLNSLGSAHKALGETSRAISYYEQLLTMRRQLYGEQSHPDIAESLNNLGSSYEALDEIARAINYYEQLLIVKKQLCGDRLGLDFAQLLSKLGRAYEALGKTAHAIGYYEQSLTIREAIKRGYEALSHRSKAMIYCLRSTKKQNVEFADSLNDLGGAYEALGDHSKAINYCLRSYTICSLECYRRPHPVLARALRILGTAHVGSDLAIKYCEESITMYQQVYNNHPHPDIAESLGSLGNVYRSSGNLPKAIEYLQRSYEMFTKTVGADHPKAKQTKTSLEAAIAASQPSTSSSDS